MPSLLTVFLSIPFNKLPCLPDSDAVAFSHFFSSSDGLPSLVIQDFGIQEQPQQRTFSSSMPRAASATDLPLGDGCAFVCQLLPDTASTETVNISNIIIGLKKNHPNFLFVAQVNSSELESLDSSSFPENIAPIFKKLRRKEKTLRLKSQELENKLEMSETACYTLAEENSDLKTAIESLETEILEVRF